MRFVDALLLLLLLVFQNNVNCRYRGNWDKRVRESQEDARVRVQLADVMNRDMSDLTSKSVLRPLWKTS
jgi:hypothetical protein